jgi:hypothetical protein
VDQNAFGRLLELVLYSLNVPLLRICGKIIACFFWQNDDWKTRVYCGATSLWGTGSMPIIRAQKQYSTMVRGIIFGLIRFWFSLWTKIFQYLFQDKSFTSFIYVMRLFPAPISWIICIKWNHKSIKAA